LPGSGSESRWHRRWFLAPFEPFIGSFDTLEVEHCRASPAALPDNDKPPVVVPTLNKLAHSNLAKCVLLADRERLKGRSYSESIKAHTCLEQFLPDFYAHRDLRLALKAGQSAPSGASSCNSGEFRHDLEVNVVLTDMWRTRLNPQSAETIYPVNNEAIALFQAFAALPMVVKLLKKQAEEISATL